MGKHYTQRPSSKRDPGTIYTQYITVCVTDSMFEFVDKDAKKLGVTKSEYIRLVLSDYMDIGQEMSTNPPNFEHKIEG